MSPSSLPLVTFSPIDGGTSLLNHGRAHGRCTAYRDARDISRHVPVVRDDRIGETSARWVHRFAGLLIGGEARLISHRNPERCPRPATVDEMHGDLAVAGLSAGPVEHREDRRAGGA